MKISIFGTGYVGLVQGACLADLGHDVVCVDIDKAKIEKLGQGKVPFYEPGLKELIEKNKKRLLFTNDAKTSIDFADIIFIAVGTPQRNDGSAQLKFVREVAKQIGQNMKDYKLIVVKSTVPPGTNEEIEKIIAKYYKGKFSVASNPEFLRQGNAVSDFMKPDRIVIGVSDEKSTELLKTVYAPLPSQIIITDKNSSELIKYASNSFLATKISFINSVAALSEKVGGNIDDISLGIGLDKRIGTQFLKAGIGYGGSCFPKDVKALMHISKKFKTKFKILKEVDEVNKKQRELPVVKLENILKSLKGKNIAVLGLSFKPDTDDIREAPSIEILKQLVKKGAKIKAWDPVAEPAVKKLVSNVHYCPTPYEALENADAALIVTEWSDVKNLDLNEVKTLMKNPIIIDGRNVLDKKKALSLGITYQGIGR